MYLGPIGQNCTSRSCKNSILSLVMSLNFGQPLNNSLKILKNAENTPFSIPMMIYVKRTTFVEKLSYKLMINFVMVQPLNCQKSNDCATRNNYNLLSDSNSCCQHFVDKLMVDRTMTATLMEGSDCPGGQNGCKVLQNQPKILAKPKRRGKNLFSTDSEVFRPAESESEVSFLSKKYPGSQMELLILAVHNCRSSQDPPLLSRSRSQTIFRSLNYRSYVVQ